MSQYYAHNVRTEVATFKEIFFIFAIFAFILYILYPEDMLRKQVLKEKSNYALTAIYLEYMLKLDPKNSELLLAAAKVSLKNGNIDLSQELMVVLEKSSDNTIQDKLLIVKYKVLQAQKNRVKNSEEVTKIDKQMSKLLNNIAKKGLFEKKNALLWYNHAIALSQKESALLFLKPLYKTGDIYALQQCVYLAIKQKDKEDRLYCIDALAKKKSNTSTQWLIASYHIHKDEGDSKKSIEILHEIIKLDPSYKKELADLQLSVGNFEMSSQVYLSLSQYSVNRESQKMYLFKAIQALQQGGLKKEAIALAQEHEEQYLSNDDIVQDFIKLYLSMDALEAARTLSVKLLNKEPSQ